MARSAKVGLLGAVPASNWSTFGLGALLFAFLQLVASYAVLKGSDGDEVVDWKYQPSVYLAILTGHFSIWSPFLTYYNDNSRVSKAGFNLFASI